MKEKQLKKTKKTV